MLWMPPSVRERQLVPEIFRELGISTATFYKWRAKFGGRDTSIMARIKKLEERLKSEIVAEALAKKWRGPVADARAKYAVQMRSIPIRLACAAFMVSESRHRYVSKQYVENEEIANWLIHLTDNHRNGDSACAICTCVTSRTSDRTTSGCTASIGSWSSTCASSPGSA